MPDYLGQSGVTETDGRPEVGLYRARLRSRADGLHFLFDSQPSGRVATREVHSTNRPFVFSRSVAIGRCHCWVS